MRILSRFLRDERAVTSVEYSVVLAAILMVVLGAIGLVGTQSDSVWNNVVTSIESQGEGETPADPKEKTDKKKKVNKGEKIPASPFM